ncbi:hypothetical protein WJX81_008596 [Elliptochloris bilobata]|uniref:Prolyl endopeptidase n=1 Tax=Elliptochloris bilobata TaxID=381761 RepID=A0AAW1SM43_9CHLO
MAALLLLASTSLTLAAQWAVPEREGAAQGGLSVQPAEYPPVWRNESQVEDYPGGAVRDPYQWLESTDSPETRAFVAAQMNLTRRVLGQCDTRDRFRALFSQIYNYPKYGAPFQRGRPGGVMRYYYEFNTGLQAQSTLYSMATSDGYDNATLVIDPNALSKDGTVAVNGYAFNWGGGLIAYNVASAGSDWETIKLMRINNATGAAEALPDTLADVKFSSTGWTPDDKGFFYNRYTPVGNATGQSTGANTNQQLWYHVVGTPQAADTFVLALPDHPDWSLGAGVTDDEKHIVVSITTGTDPTNQLWYTPIAALPVDASTGALDLARYDMRRPADARPALPLTRLVDNFRASYGVVAAQGDIWTLQTSLNAPRGRLIRVNISNPGSVDSWQEVLAQHPRDQLVSATAVKGDALVVQYTRDVTAVLQQRSLASGALVREVPLPGLGSVDLTGRREQSEILFTYTDMTQPGSTYRFDTATPAVSPVLLRRVELPGGWNLRDYNTTQVFVPSKDGTRIPMFIVARKNVTLDGNNPTFLYAYGGFDITVGPTFSVSRLAFLRAYNGVYAIAGIRGGGEYGLDWWEGGRLHKKQNGFDDFASCAQYLHDAGYSSPSRLTIEGGSNGGLLMGAEVNQHPNLFAAIIAQVGVMDLLRFPLFTIGHAWVTEYGDPSNATDFPYLHAESPLQNVAVPSGSGQYPAVMVTTADHDDRVVPLHSYKFLATLQHVLAGYPGSPQRNPLVLRVDVNAGHGGGKPTGKIMDEYSDEYAFAAAAMRAPWVLTPPPAEEALPRHDGALHQAVPGPAARLQAAAVTG